MSKRQDNSLLLFASFVVLFLMYSGFMAGSWQQRRDIRESAIKSGVGRYVVDPASGHVGFEWIVKGEETE